MFDTKYGHVKVKFHDHQFIISPTLEAMSLIGEREDIIQVFAKLHCTSITSYLSKFQSHSPEIIEMMQKYARKVTGPQQLAAAHLVLSCCCAEDLSAMIGKYVIKERVFYQVGFESPDIIIKLAQFMMYHGMIGHSENRVTKCKSATSPTFEPSRFVELARLKLKLTRDEAWSLTMTEFLSLWETEFPPTDKAKDETISKEEYRDEVAKLEAIRDRAIKRAVK